MAAAAVVFDNAGWMVLNRLLPTTATRTTAAAAPAIANSSRPGRRREVASSGVTEAPEEPAARWACSAARLALIRSIR